ncbi:zinc-dependent alcohol dehydrogenase [Blastococcus saxobsidens]|uniref:S-(Hydroxymethyl)glutathione dehydrogenase (Glutathione-dependent formaldehyde dehydrogenase) (Fdh) n=1 Tax=Blastococcus saxobsidens (strain DD2) TaxID=1146883 RepID=H6RJZ6_BLASD|nr:zinc-dependent alcohol dehydrogenase [Blastococcus saxobsidens]CCG04852.1 S-(hydroxymethyl)glutathione dehydrogenase (Glutathione-dependent formaldehyde dehydrogenase) (fdh) [Blastococcus saxobsidens DD2]
MRATQWMGKNHIEVNEVPDPQILNDRDAIVKISSTAICGSDLHLYDGFIPTMRKGDIVGHEFMGEVVELGKGVGNLKVGDRVVVPFPISCGNCVACQKGLFSVCENSNPNARIAEKVMGHAPCGIFGYSHMMGGYPGGQAEYARVPFADVGPLKVDDDLTDEQVLFLTDVFPTGYMGADNCDISPGDVVAVWGAGAVGQFAVASAKMLGAERVIAIDRFDYRLDKAKEAGATDVLDYEDVDVLDALQELTAGRGPDAAIDCVGMEAHHPSTAINAYDRAKQATMLETERPHALREAILAVKNGGTVSIVGVYGGLMDKFPIGSLMNRSLTVRTGQAHVQRYLKPLYERIRNGDIDPSFVVSHTLPLEQAPQAYRMFRDKEDSSNKVVLKP